jgi:hypothetical protein
LTEKFTWPADMPQSERGRYSKVIDPGGEHHGEAKQAMNVALAGFAMKRHTGGITYQHDGRFWDAPQLRVTTYSTNVNSVATAVSSSNTTYKDYDK